MSLLEEKSMRSRRTNEPISDGIGPGRRVVSRRHGAGGGGSSFGCACGIAAIVTACGGGGSFPIAPADSLTPR